MSFPIDLARAETSPFEPSSVHRALSDIDGRWRGGCRLWLEPGSPPEETVTELEAVAILGGRWLELSYRGMAMGRPHAGRMLIGFQEEAREVELAWVDSFHTSPSILLSKGSAAGEAIDVLGSYMGGGERWGWRTKIERPSQRQLVLRAFNVAPAGEEYPALEWLLSRVEG